MARFGVSPPAAATVRRYLPVDALAIAAFVLAGEQNHDVTLTAVAWVANTAVPFYAGWVLGAVLAGAYAATADDSLGRFAARSLGGWVLGAGVAMLLRNTAAFHGEAATTLFLVASGAGGALLLGGRVARRAVARR